MGVHESLKITNSEYNILIKFIEETIVNLRVDDLLAKTVTEKIDKIARLNLVS